MKTKTNNMGHNILRQVGQFQLCVDNSTDTPTYYIDNEILIKHTTANGRSYNFDEEKKGFLMLLNDSDFVQRAKQRAGNDINCLEVAKSIWSELGDTPVTDDGDLDAIFTTHDGYEFEVGTDREDIWSWFEETFNLSVAKDLMGLE